MTDERDVVAFEEVGRGDIALVGGKGANLGEMLRAKIPVPGGFIVTADAYGRFIEESGLRPKIEAILNSLDVHDSDALQKASRDIEQMIIDTPVPDDIAGEVKRRYREMGEPPVAVRSSATAEDLPEASFAGQQSTFLNVVGADRVVQAVKECWASLFEARAIFYRSENAFEHMKVKIAVPVQKMVQSESSGVIFTVEPVTSDRSKITVEAIVGLGEGLVSGEISPDMYIVDKGTMHIVEKQLAPQDRKLARTTVGSGKGIADISWQEVPGNLRSAQKLSDDEIVQVAEIAKRIEEHYGFPQDIEWAREGKQFYIVQTRPVTTLAEATAAPAEALEEKTPVLLKGSAASPGAAAGEVKIILDPSQISRVHDGDILVAEMTTPNFVPAMKRAVAIVTDRGGRTAHAAIVSRELGIPCVVGTGEATKTLREGQIVTVDGARGVVYDGRAEATLAHFEREKAAATASSAKTKTRVYVNLAQPDLADRVATRNVDGVGLLRAEFIVADIGEHPRYALEQGRGEEFTAKMAEGILQFARAFDPRPVVYRTTDFKTNEYSGLKGGEKYEESEENPMIGYRGASRYIRDREVFQLEVEAIKRVRQDHKNLHVMIPFVRTPEEMAGVKKALEELGLKQSPEFKLWMMVEVPSNVILLNEFIDVGIDGVSIGSNDLTQLTLGIDRDNAVLAKDFDERNLAVTRSLEQIVTTCRQRGVTSSICGQAPSDYPELTEKLVEWGITSVSVNPDVIDRTRKIIAAAEAKLGIKPG
ncbi:MAG TPA: phosphoenolpyruvate synthase [Dehalococcoidia bacterium]|nr:phosphoenolpyruvate synthase [Dehalococcoidia bacterium]